MSRETLQEERESFSSDVELICDLCARWSQTFINAKSPKLDPNVTEGLDQSPEKMPQGVVFIYFWQPMSPAGDRVLLHT